MRESRAQAIARYLGARGYIVGKAGVAGLEIFAAVKGPAVVELGDRTAVGPEGYRLLGRWAPVTHLSVIFIGRPREIYRIPEDATPRGVAERVRSLIETHDPALAAQAADRLERRRRAILDNEARRQRYAAALDADAKAGAP